MWWLNQNFNCEAIYKFHNNLKIWKMLPRPTCKGAEPVKGWQQAILNLDKHERSMFFSFCVVMETERYKTPPNRTRAFFLSLLPSATLQLSPQVILLAPASQQAASSHLRRGENKRGCNTASVQMTASPGLQLALGRQSCKVLRKNWSKFLF